MSAAESTPRRSPDDATPRRSPDRRCSILLSLLDRLLERGVVPSGMSLDGLELDISHLRSEEPTRSTASETYVQTSMPPAVQMPGDTSVDPRFPVGLDLLASGDDVVQTRVVTPTDGPFGRRRRAHEQLRRLMREDGDVPLPEYTED